MVLCTSAPDAERISVTYLHGDHLGSTSVTRGAAVSTQTYCAYGAVGTTSGALPTDFTVQQNLSMHTDLLLPHDWDILKM